MDLELFNTQELICRKTQTTNNLFQYLQLYWVLLLGILAFT